MRGPLVIVGDALLDIDIEGMTDRLSPDAPVPVVDGVQERPRPGGAGLAALLATADTDDVVIVTALGDDEAGRRLLPLLRRFARVVPLRLRGSTPCKLRVRAHGQSLVRLDLGEGRAAPEPVDARVRGAIRGAGAVLVADYGRGVAEHAALRRLLAELPPEIPVVWDPHPRGGTPLPGSRLVTPNAVEAVAFAGDGARTTEIAAVSRSAQRLALRWEASGVAVTLGARGALLASAGGVPVVIPPPHDTAGTDVCGAGDRFATAVTWALGSGLPLSEAVAEGVRAASRFVAAGGAAAIAEELTADRSGTVPQERDAWDVVEHARRRGETIVATGGCFDLLHAGHVSMLRHARRLGDHLIVCVNSDASVRRLKGPDRPIVPLPDRIRVLEALEDVDAVAVFDEDTPIELLARLRPDVWAKGADYAGVPLPEAEAVRAHGGEIALLPHVDGRSTSGLVAAARGHDPLPQLDEWEWADAERGGGRSTRDGVTRDGSAQNAAQNAAEDPAARDDTPRGAARDAAGEAAANRARDAARDSARDRVNRTDRAGGTGRDRARGGVARDGAARDRANGEGRPRTR
jgi:D-beta-D-heptose 7-phosphate kinase / D-beta-D-heptose 1-phosphate adenosyltransferase